MVGSSRGGERAELVTAVPSIVPMACGSTVAGGEEA